MKTATVITIPTKETNPVNETDCYSDCFCQQKPKDAELNQLYTALI